MSEPILTPVVPVVPILPEVKPVPEAKTEEKPKVEAKTEEKKEEKKPEPPQKKKFKFKVDDKEIEEEWDEAEIHQRLQKVYGIEKKAQSASEMKKQAEAFFEVLKNGDFSFLDKLGVNSKEVVSKWLVDQMTKEADEASLTPEQKELRQTKSELEKIRKEKQDKEDKDLNEHLEKQTNERIELIQKDFVDACKAQGVPISKMTFQRTLYYIDWARENKKVSLNPSDVMPIVKKEAEEFLKNYFSNAGVDDYYKVLGDNITKLRQAEIEKIKPKMPKRLPASEEKETKKKKQPFNRTPYEDD